MQKTGNSFRRHPAVSHVPDGESFPSEGVVRREDLERVAVSEREEATSALRDEPASVKRPWNLGRNERRLTIIPMR